MLFPVICLTEFHFRSDETGHQNKIIKDQINQFIVRRWSLREQHVDRSAELKCETVGYCQVIAMLSLSTTKQ